jgi:hypothetical protein
MEFQSHIVAASQSMKKNWGSHPLLLCLQTSKGPTLIQQLWLASRFCNLDQGLLTEGEGSVWLTSSVR